ncbi:MAG TPA: flagellar basal-body MS-ring/collar protein FliF [Steroidobacteraceae bacterium]|jgi:flagellar M-ring protein FliF
MANSQTFHGRVGLNLRPLLLLLGIAAAVAVGVTVVLWWRGPNWSLLYGNLADSDASSVVQALQTASIDYKLDPTTGAIMVPAERVHEARLQLAGQGLPQGKSASLDLISKDPGFGVSQFMENARYQYALEGELSRTISSLQAVEAARIHLALPQQSAFVRERRPASASVLLQLRAGHRLQAEQVSAIVHLVASSIPELDSDNVTVVDQQGRLLSSPKNSEAAVTAEQFEAAHRIEDSYVDHIEKLIAPLVGDGRVHAEVTVDLDAGATEEAHEQYKPDGAVVRSEQSSEETSRSGSAASGGVPGALTNQPPAGGTASPPSTAKPPAAATAATSAAAASAAAASASSAAASTPESSSRQNSRNYEIDRTVSYSRQPAGRVKRVTVAVLVDNLRQVGADGKAAERPLTKAEIEDITRLVKDAVGFDEARGDSVNVVNQPFQPQTVETLKPEPVPLWQRPWLRDVLRLVLGALVLVALALGVLRPLIKNLSAHALAAPPPELLPADGRGADMHQATASAAFGPAQGYQQQLVQARGLVTQDAKRVAQVVRTWVGEQ